MSSLKATLYHGQPFDTNTAAIIPIDDKLNVEALMAFCSSPSYAIAVRDRDVRACRDGTGRSRANTRDSNQASRARKGRNGRNFRIGV
jgi:hypothetical protein